MIIQRYSLPNHTDLGGDVNTFKQFFDTLAEWDSVEEISSENIKYTYSGLTINIMKSSNNSAYTRIEISHNDTSITLDGSVKNAKYINFIIIKTTTSVGVILLLGGQNAVIAPGVVASGVYRFVLTKCFNTDIGAEEKGVVFVEGSTANTFKVQVDSVSRLNTNYTVMTTLFNSLTTLLTPATCQQYTGYCPYVFVPLYQTCEATHGKCEVDGTSYYIMSGSLYLLDD